MIARKTVRKVLAWHVLEFLQISSKDIMNLFPTNVTCHDFAVGSFQIRVLLRIFFLAITFQKRFISMLCKSVLWLN